MEHHNITVTEKRQNLTIPELDITDILTIIVLVLIGALLMTDRPVPEYLIGLVGLGAGIKVHTQRQIEKLQ